MISIFFIYVLYSNHDPDPYQLAVTTSEPSANIANAVNVITGDYFIHESNFIIQGAEPIIIDPIYISKNSKKNWSFLNHLYIEHFLFIVAIPESSGAIIKYNSASVGFPKTIKNNNKQSDENRKIFNQNTYDHLKLMESSYRAGLSNCSNSEISGRLNVKNNQVLMNLNRNKIVVKCANGSTRNYERYTIKNMFTHKAFGQTMNVSATCFYLKEETLPNNNKILYQYDNQHRLVKISTTNFNKSKIYSTINIQYLNDQVIFTSSDNKTMHCFLTNRNNFILQKYALFPERPNEDYEFIYDDDIKYCICQRNTPDGRDFHVEYYTRGTHVVNGNTIQVKDISDPKLMRVKSIKSKTALNGELVENYRFIYHLDQDPTSGYTEVYDANNIKTIYRYSNLRLDAIEKYDENNVLKSKEIVSWGNGQNATKDVTFLLSKTFLDSEKNIIFHKEFIYDQKGNIIKESLYGNLSGEKESVKFDPQLSFENNISNVKINLENFSKHKTYTNDIRNLLLSEEDDNQVKIEYTYIDRTDLVKSKIIKNKNEIKIREFYEYNDDFILVKETIDDGQNDNVYDLTQVTQRLIKTISPKKENPFINLPEIIEEKYFDFEKKEEKLLKKTVLTYSNHGKVIKEDIYNSNDQKEYSIEKKYDDHGRAIEEINPEGHKTTYDLYDDNYNLLKKKDPSEKTTNFEYDFVNRLIKKEEIPIIGRSHETQISYDLKSNIFSISDYLGNITNFEYDCFNNLIKTIKPYTTRGYSTINSKYDDMSRKTQAKDGNGNVTETEYNSYNKPITITYANGSSERFIYNLNGTLKKHIDQIDTSTTYEYDFLQRDIKKIIKSSDNKSKITHEKNYTAFNLLSEKDAEVNVTTYKYDHAGRKILEKLDNEEIAFFYDDLSRLCTSVLIDDDKSLYNFEVKDYLNRVIEQRKEDRYHNIFYRIGYRYDHQNNKTAIIRYINNQCDIEKFEYDSFNRLSKHEDANGIVDTTQYIEDNNHLQKKHIDLVGLETVETYDSLGRVITQGKFMKNALLSKEEFIYDLSDNLIVQKSTVINQKDKSCKIVEIKREYDEMNKETALIEAFNSKDQKETKYIYTKKGQLAQTIKPNQIVLTYEYDFLNNNTRLFSSYNSEIQESEIQELEIQEIDYKFTYNNLGQMVVAKNNISGLKTTRELDHKGRILKETLENNLTIENIYDKKGNRIKLILPEQTFIEYEYDPCYLKKVIRKDSSGFELYRHEYLNYDLDGNSLLQNLINDTQLLQDFDIIGRKTKVENPHFTQTIDFFNPDGTINQMSYKTTFRKDTSKYEYDFLKQLTKEEGLFTKEYCYDSHNNRLKKNNNFYDINDLNQVIKATNDEIKYDANGNPKYKHGPDGDIFYKYDALDRLISIEKTNDYKLEFEYDALHRRVFKKYIKYVKYWFSAQWEEKSEDKYLYDNQNEIAALDQQNEFKELRVLGDSNYAEIGAALALEIDNNVYIPIHDIQGNLSCVISDNNDVEIYRYSAFGEEKIFKNKVEYPNSQIKNNWRFSSKRKDESNLIYFGRRYYDADYGRWLTPDPEGFKDGLNLYAFVLNDPLIKVDLYGLELFAHLPNPLFYQAMDKALGRKPTQAFDLNKKEIFSNKRIYFENGVYNSFKDARESTQYLSKMANNSNIYGIYNENVGVGSDILRAIMSLTTGIQSKASKLTATEWMKYLDQDKKNEILHICHSEGAINTKNALKNLPDGYRKRINVVAIAPATFMAPAFAKNIYHYPVDKDLITKIDFENKKRYSDSISILDSNGYEDRHVHSFQHPIYKRPLKTQIKKFLIQDE